RHRPGPKASRRVAFAVVHPLIRPVALDFGGDRGTAAQPSSRRIVLMNEAAEHVDEIQTRGPWIPHRPFAKLRLGVEHQLGVDEGRDHVVPLNPRRSNRTGAAILVILCWRVASAEVKVVRSFWTRQKG